VQGTVYTRWGRPDCPAGNHTELVYSGYVGGSFYTSPGAAANAVCLPNNPTFGDHQLSDSGVSTAFIYGAEFEEYAMFGLPHQDEDVACAVCRHSDHSTVTMIPARTSCYPGWTEAYGGLLVAGYPTQHAATEYICMDGQPTSILGGNKNDNGKLFYAVSTKCGSLQCPPYDNDQIVSCVVCMK
ncbi:short-chain collagen C4-like, partial [Mizuhopecten yessoensis]|uniref:short-chain collagen C4-like n=1 Tax=Mizuhopecten yessoensis TaxID=6573 RepID=UPI000B459CFD